MALWSWSASPQKASLPNVSKRKICLPSSISFWAWAPIVRSFSESFFGAAFRAALACSAARSRDQPKDPVQSEEQRVKRKRFSPSYGLFAFKFAFPLIDGLGG